MTTDQLRQIGKKRAEQAARDAKIDPQNPAEYFAGPEFRCVADHYYSIPPGALAEILKDMGVELLTPREVESLRDLRGRLKKLDEHLEAAFDAAVIAEFNTKHQTHVEQLIAGTAKHADLEHAFDVEAAYGEARRRRAAISTAKKALAADGFPIMGKVCQRIFDSLARLCYDLDGAERLNADRFGVKFAPSGTLFTLANFLTGTCMRPAKDFVPGLSETVPTKIHGMELAA